MTFNSGETRGKVLYIQHYGFKSIPRRGTACLTASNGDRESAIIIGSKAIKEPELKEGDAAIFSDQAFVKASGDKVNIGNGSEDMGSVISELLEIVAAIANTKIPPNSGMPAGLDLVSAAKIEGLKAKWKNLTQKV